MTTALSEAMPEGIIGLNFEHLQNLDLSPAQRLIEKLLQEGTIASHEQQIRFEINFPREAEDPRELSEIPEVRLWFIRLDAKYPWLPFLLDWKAGELARYVAMLVPHQFSRTEGIQFNPEALEIFVMQKTFVLDWKAGELARYVAMLVPHQFSRTEGIQFNPEALEIFVMQKTFVLTDWLQKQGIPSQSRVQSMAQILGYELDSTFFDFIQ